MNKKFKNIKLNTYLCSVFKNIFKCRLIVFNDYFIVLLFVLVFLVVFVT